MSTVVICLACRGTCDVGDKGYEPVPCPECKNGFLTLEGVPLLRYYDSINTMLRRSNLSMTADEYIAELLANLKGDSSIQ